MRDLRTAADFIIFQKSKRRAFSAEAEKALVFCCFETGDMVYYAYNFQTGGDSMSETLKQVKLFTDGACSGNPGPGGWAAILRYGAHEKEMSGSMPRTTNNRMEVFAVISGLGALKTRCRVEVYSDSTYVVNAFEQHWLDNWQKRGWKTADGKQVENQDLWKLLLLVVRKHEVTFHKVKGHADHPENNRCDELARAAIRQYLKINPDMNENGEEIKAF